MSDGTAAPREPRAAKRDRGRVRASLRLAWRDQLWRLNEQGALVLHVTEAGFRPGAPAVNAPITGELADVTLQRYLRHRWAGLERFPRRGDTWVVRDGLVVPVPLPEDVGEDAS